MPDLPSLIIVGAGGLGRGVAALVESINARTPTWHLRGFVDDDEALHGDSVMGYPVHGDVDWLSQKTDLRFVTAIGDREARRHVANQLNQAPVQSTSLTHPSVSVHRTAEVEPGTILREGVATAVDFQIGPHAVLNMNCTIGHDSVLNAFVTLHPGVHISGSARLKTGVTMGSGSVVLPNITIGRDATIGAGAVVTEDLPAYCTAVGIPARPLS